MLVPVLFFAMQISPVTDLHKASALYSDCKAWVALTDKTRETNNDDALHAVNCVGYMNGFIEGGLTKICAKDVPTMTMARVFIAYMDKNPKLFDERRSVVLYLALTDAYSCPTK